MKVQIGKFTKIPKRQKCHSVDHMGTQRWWDYRGPRVPLGGKMCPAVQKASVSERIVATHKMTFRACAKKNSSNLNLTSVQHVACICVYMRVYSWFTSFKWWFYKAIYEFLVARAISQERLAFYNNWRLRELGPGGRARGWEVDVFSLWLWRWFQLIYSHLDPEFTY